MRPQHMDPQAAEQLRFLTAAFTELVSDDDLERQRQLFKSVLGQISNPAAHEFDGVILDDVVGDGQTAVPVRRYEPRNAVPGAGVVYFHGGGWVFGDRDTGDRFARAMARQLGVTVVSVEYRRAPEHRFPAALLDCVAVAERARSEFGLWCAVAGDSAGGGLALAAAIASGVDRSYDAQLLLYPAIDASMTTESYELYAEGYGLSRKEMEFYWDAYAGDHSRLDPLLAPANATELERVPPTVLVTAGFDVLYDEGENLARRLIAAGVPVAYLPFKSLPHGFIDLVDRVLTATWAVQQALASFASFVPSQHRDTPVLA